MLEKGTPGLARLIEDIKYEFKRSGGILQTFDGGFVRCPSEHAALNYKLQSAGEILMKYALILAINKIKELNLDAKLIGKIHDEYQFECPENLAKQVGELCVACITEAGKLLGFKVPLTGNYKIGANWAECH